MNALLNKRIIRNFFDFSNILANNKQKKIIQFVDVRTPLEYNEDHIPLSLNWPVLSNEERRIVGELYKKDESKNKTNAKVLGAHYVTMNISNLLEKEEIKQVIKNMEKDTCCLVLYCARGGLRSQSLATVLSMILNEKNENLFLIDGGYKTYRNHVLLNLQDSNFLNQFEFYSINGFTVSS